jgi:hypothetical protein
MAKSWLSCLRYRASSTSESPCKPVADQIDPGAAGDPRRALGRPALWRRFLGFVLTRMDLPLAFVAATAAALAVQTLALRFVHATAREYLIKIGVSP